QSSWSFLPSHLASDTRNDVRAESTVPDPQLFGDILEALRVMQDSYFQPWVGTWPTAIDWTAAVMGTHVAAALTSISEGLGLIHPLGSEEYSIKENVVSLYFTQLIGFYFGQDAFAIRLQAFDDMLWVVLNWLDAIQFIDAFSKSRDSNLAAAASQLTDPTEILRNQSWHGNLWIPAFAHRARLFWELASTGWDTKLCGGGMTWNPRLMPYKNAITNELYIAGSIGMYIYFPGDDNAAPFNVTLDPEPPRPQEVWHPHDPKYFTAAVDAYAWLTSSNMTNSQGLYVDGFHISGYPSGSNNTKCDQRDEMVYTYNQGVLLSGQLNLFRVTGDAAFLRAGHVLVQNVIRATGYNLGHQSPVDDVDALFPGQLPPWHGLGRAGILEDACDVGGQCSQNAQTFKGIWMHHFAVFCSLLEPPPADLPFVTAAPSFDAIRAAHFAACQRYVPWLGHNARAARGTRDGAGKYGMWWTVGLLNLTESGLQITPAALPPPTPGTIDYRNYGVPNDPVWVATDVPLPPLEMGSAASPLKAGDEVWGQRPMANLVKRGRSSGGKEKRDTYPDPNTRGRGRTVETQGTGLAALRAFWEVSNQ
ncbi:hypothetical protein B0T17DRAFT_459531, partial [Bombardia bombarda]